MLPKSPAPGGWGSARDRNWQAHFPAGGRSRFQPSARGAGPHYPEPRARLRASRAPSSHSALPGRLGHLGSGGRPFQTSYSRFLRVHREPPRPRHGTRCPLGLGCRDYGGGSSKNRRELGRGAVYKMPSEVRSELLCVPARRKWLKQRHLPRRGAIFLPVGFTFSSPGDCSSVKNITANRQFRKSLKLGRTVFNRMRSLPTSSTSTHEIVLSART